VDFTPLSRRDRKLKIIESYVATTTAAERVRLAVVGESGAVYEPE